MTCSGPFMGASEIGEEIYERDEREIDVWRERGREERDRQL